MISATMHLNHLHVHDTLSKFQGTNICKIELEQGNSDCPVFVFKEWIFTFLSELVSLSVNSFILQHHTGQSTFNYNAQLLRHLHTKYVNLHHLYLDCVRVLNQLHCNVNWQVTHKVKAHTYYLRDTSKDVTS